MVALEDQKKEKIFLDVDDDFFEEEEKDIIKKEPSFLEKKISFNSVLVSFSFLFICFIFSSLYWKNPKVYDFYLMKKDLFSSENYYHIFSSILAHSDLSHFLNNTFLIFIFGALLYNYYGFYIFPVLSFTLGGLANALTIYFYTASNIRLLGASSMAYAMTAIWLFWYFRYGKNKSKKIKFMRVLAFTFVILLPTKFSPETSYLGHFLGFILGVLAAFIFSFSMDKKVALEEEKLIQLQ